MDFQREHHLNVFWHCESAAEMTAKKKLLETPITTTLYLRQWQETCVKNNDIVTMNNIIAVCNVPP
jgi:hypothetical protein